MSNWVCSILYLYLSYFSHYDFCVCIQPALLYIVPAVIGFLAAHCIWNGEVKQVCLATIWSCAWLTDYIEFWVLNNLKSFSTWLDSETLCSVAFYICTMTLMANIMIYVTCSCWSLMSLRLPRLCHKKVAMPKLARKSNNLKCHLQWTILARNIFYFSFWGSTLWKLNSS